MSLRPTISDASDRPRVPASTRDAKLSRGRSSGPKSVKPVSEPVKLKPAPTLAPDQRPKMTEKRIPLKARDAVVTPKEAVPVKKTMTYGSIVAAATAKAAAVAAAAKAAAVTAAASAAIAAKNNYVKKSINVTSKVSESSAYSEARRPLKNPEKQAEFKAARLKKLQAASELTNAEAAQIEAVKKKHEFDDVVMKLKLQRYLQYQKDSTVMLQCFGSLLEEAFTCVSQLWGNDHSLMDRWSQSESLPKLHWEYMLSEDDFKSRGFTIVINPSTVDTVQVFGLDPLEKESAGSSVLRMVVDSAFAIFCGQVPSMKTDVVMLVHGEASSGRSIGKQLAAMNIHHEFCYYLVAFSRNALFTEEPVRVPSPPPLPPVEQPPPPPPLFSQHMNVTPSFSMVQNNLQYRPPAPFIQYDTSQNIGRAAAINLPQPSPPQHFSYLAPPFYPNEPPSHFPPGFSPSTTARFLGNISSNAVFHSEHDDRNLQERAKKSKKSKEQPSRPHNPPKKSHTPDISSIYGDGGESRSSFFPAPTSSTNRDSIYGAKAHSDPHRDQDMSQSNSRADRVPEIRKDNKRTHSQSIEDERGRGRMTSSQSNANMSSKDRPRSSKDASRDSSRDHSGHHSLEHSKDRVKDHSTDYSRDHQRSRESPSEPSIPLCKFFSNGACKFGSKCRDLHSRPSDSKAKSKINGTERCDRCEICGRYSHATNKCDDKHQQRNATYFQSNIRWAESRYGKMWKMIGHENTQPGISLPSSGALVVNY
jgi:Zinc finger C-x8-C-x5-C-x3-H type (and similar)